jgi:hypothetical protein
MPAFETLNGDYFRISDNPRFPTCEAEAVANQLVGFSGNIVISGNDDTATCQ